MATAYKADTYGDIQVSTTDSVARTWRRNFSFNIATGTSNVGFIINDTLALCPIPYKTAGAGVVVMDYVVEIPALDTGTSVRVSLGDTNGTAGAFQATFVSAIQIGASSLGGVMSPVMCWDSATTRLPVRGVVPKQYTVGTLYTSFTPWPTVDFMLKITTAANTATTTGTIKGWLGLQVLNSASVTF